MLHGVLQSHLKGLWSMFLCNKHHRARRDFMVYYFLEKTVRKSCCISEQIIGIAMVSKRDFDNVTFDWSCNI